MEKLKGWKKLWREKEKEKEKEWKEKELKEK